MWLGEEEGGRGGRERKREKEEEKERERERKREERKPFESQAALLILIVSRMVQSCSNFLFFFEK